MMLFAIFMLLLFVFSPNVAIVLVLIWGGLLVLCVVLGLIGVLDDHVTAWYADKKDKP